MSEYVKRDYTTGTECAVCGQATRPENGWIYKSTDVKPVDFGDGGVRWEAKDGVDAYCSVDCTNNANE